MYEGNKKFCLDKMDALNKCLSVVDKKIDLLLNKKTNLKNYFFHKRVRNWLIIGIFLQVGATIVFPYLIPVTIVSFLLSMRSICLIIDELKKDCYDEFSELHVKDEKVELEKLEKKHQDLLKERFNLKKQIVSCKHLIVRLNYYSKLIEKNKVDNKEDSDTLESTYEEALENYLNEKIDISKVYFDNSLPNDFSNSYNGNSKKLVKKN